MATRTRIAKSPAPKAPVAEKPWWYGLNKATADELLRRGYQSREDAALMTGRLHYPGRSDRARQWAHDPLYASRPWLGPRLISMDIVAEVLEWLEKSGD